jgi:hypothetical protein
MVVFPHAGLYGAVYLASQVLCSAAKIDIWETFQPTPGVFVVGLAFALPLIVVSECMHHDFVVERWLPAQAVREAEEDENADFFTGMSTAQVCYEIVYAYCLFLATCLV